MNGELREKIRRSNYNARLAEADGYTVADGYVWEGWGNPTGPCARKVCRIEDYEATREAEEPEKFNRTHFETRTEAIDRYIVPALGDFAGCYDLEGIFEEAFEWRGGYLTPTKEAEGGGFYDIAQRHEIERRAL